MGVLGGLGPTILIVLWIQVTIAIFMVSLRAYAASRRDNKWRWDFIWIVLSLITGVLAAIFVTKAVMTGMGQHLIHLTLDEDFGILYWNYIAIYMGTLSIAFSKFSVTALLLDVLRGSEHKWKRWSLWAVCAVFTVVTILEILLTAFQCHPISKVWKVFAHGDCPAQKEARAVSFIHSSESLIILVLCHLTVLLTLPSLRWSDGHLSRPLPHLHSLELADYKEGQDQSLRSHGSRMSARVRFFPPLPSSSQDLRHQRFLM